MRRPIEDQVVVITGASSGIGRETALEFARRGAAVVLAARSEHGLRTLADEIRAFHGRAHVVVTDVAEAEQVNRLAREAAGAFGRIDTWVNDAAVSEYGTFEQMTDDEFARIVQVNLMGTVYGTRAAIEHLRGGGNGGTIINIGSVLSDRAIPLQSAYVATKHAVKGFTDSIRMELEHARSGIDVTLILPASTNTPFFDHAKSKMGVKGNPVPPIYEPSVVADAIVYAAEHKVRELYIGAPGKLFSVMQRISPSFLDWYMTKGGRMFHRQQSDQPDVGENALHRPGARNGSSRGRFGHRAMQSSLYTKYIDPHPNVKRAMIGLVAAGAAAALVGIGRASKSSTARSRAAAMWDRMQARVRARRELHSFEADERVRLMKYGFAPVVRAMIDAGIDPRQVPGFDRLSARFLTRLSAVDEAGDLRRARPARA